MEETVKTLNPEYLRAVAQKVSGSPYFGLLSMEVKSLGWGQSHIEIEVEKKHWQPFGMVHGGAFSSLMDAACFWAVWPMIDESVGITTVDLKLNYLAPISSGTLVGKGKSVKVGKTLCLGEASIEDETGRLLAHGLSTMMILRGVMLDEPGGLPPKFLD